MILLKTSVIDDKSIISLSYLLFFFSKLKLVFNIPHKVFNILFKTKIRLFLFTNIKQSFHCINMHTKQGRYWAFPVFQLISPLYY